MEKQRSERREIFRKVSLGAALALAIAASVSVANAAADRIWATDRAREEGGKPLTGMWDVTVSGQVTYYYVYSFSGDAFVAAGNIDANWDGQGSSFGPTMGSYARVRGRSYSIREKGWAFDPQGNAAGSFGFEGTYTVGGDGTTLTGSGTWTLYDLGGNAIFVEPLTVTGTKLGQ